MAIIGHSGDIGSNAAAGPINTINVTNLVVNDQVKVQPEVKESAVTGNKMYPGLPKEDTSPPQYHNVHYIDIEKQCEFKN